jgi:hypothetical protein
MTGFWKTWMAIWCWLTIGLGVALWLGAFPATDGVARLYYDAINWPIDGGVTAPTEWTAQRPTAAILGAVLIGWGITVLFAVAEGNAGNRRAWQMLTVAMVAWFVTDSIASMAVGLPGNVVPNTAFMFTYLVPVLASGVLAGRPVPAGR